MRYTFNDSFDRTIKTMYGVFGARWLIELPLLVEKCAAKWQLTDLKPFPNLTYNYVLSGMQGEKPIVLKLRYERGATYKEARALQAFHSANGAMAENSVKLLAYDTLLSALLIERVMPGELLSTFFPHRDAEATEIAVALMRTLHQAPLPEDYLFPDLEEVIPEFTEKPRKLAPFRAQARTLRTQLLQSQTQQVLLHGDFHSGNILSSGADDNIVIDPEGIIGDPLYDVAVYIRNPMTELIAEQNAQTIVKNRIKHFAQLLGYEPQKIYDWIYLQAFTSAYWSIEDGLDASKHVAFLKLLEQV